MIMSGYAGELSQLAGRNGHDGCSVYALRHAFASNLVIKAVQIHKTPTCWVRGSRGAAMTCTPSGPAGRQGWCVAGATHNWQSEPAAFGFLIPEFSACGAHHARPGTSTVRAPLPGMVPEQIETTYASAGKAFGVDRQVARRVQGEQNMVAGESRRFYTGAGQALPR